MASNNQAGGWEGSRPKSRSDVSKDEWVNMPFNEKIKLIKKANADSKYSTKQDEENFDFSNLDLSSLSDEEQLALVKEISKKYVEKDEKARREKEEYEKMRYAEFEALAREQNELVRQAQMGSAYKGPELPLPVPVNEDPSLPEADEEEQLARAIALSMDPKEQQNPELSGLVEAFKASTEETTKHEKRIAETIFKPRAEIARDEYVEDEEMRRVLEISKKEALKQSMEFHHSVNKGAASSFKPNTNSQDKLRPIIVDGNNVGFAYTSNNGFGAKGLEIVKEWFIERGHQVIIFLTDYRRSWSESDQQICNDLFNLGILKYVPNKNFHNDDLFMLEYADNVKGIVISNDKFRKEAEAHPQFREQIEQRKMGFTFVHDTVMFPMDPLGKGSSVTREEFLKF